MESLIAFLRVLLVNVVFIEIGMKPGAVLRWKAFNALSPDLERQQFRVFEAARTFAFV
jgi:hypothetical protein